MEAICMPHFIWSIPIPDPCRTMAIYRSNTLRLLTSQLDVFLHGVSQKRDLHEHPTRVHINLQFFHEWASGGLQSQCCVDVVWALCPCPALDIHVDNVCSWAWRDMGHGTCLPIGAPQRKWNWAPASPCYCPHSTSWCSTTEGPLSQGHGGSSHVPPHLQPSPLYRSPLSPLPSVAQHAHWEFSAGC